jgi:fatty acid desaturase
MFPLHKAHEKREMTMKRNKWRWLAAIFAMFEFIVMSFRLFPYPPLPIWLCLLITVLPSILFGALLAQFWPLIHQINEDEEKELEKESQIR